MSTTKSTFKKITSLLLSLVFVISSFAVVDFSQSAAIEAKADGGEYFLMSYFTGNLQTEQQIRFAVSTDGINFKPLNGGNAILQEKSTDTNNYNGYSYTDGVRDPFIFDGHDGYYYCIATDLDATAYGFSGNQSQMVLWRSADLITWSDAFYINVAKILNDHGITYNDAAYNNSNLKRTWAPQVFYENGEYMIYFAFYADGFSSTRMHYMTTTDLFDISKYSAPEVLYDPGYDDIDADIIKEGNTYYMFYKDETPGRKTVCLASSTNLTGPYSYVGQFATSSTTGGIEGCQVYTIGSNYYLVADRYGDAGRFVIYNLGSSLANVAAASVAQSIPVDDGNPITTVDETNGFHNLTARHGSIMHISSSQYNALCSKYGGVTNDDIMYNFTTGINQGAGYGTYNDSSLRNIDFMGDGNMYVNHDSGYARLYNKCLFVNDEDVRAMFPDDVYTVSFDYSLETTTNLGAPIFALGDNSAADYVMIFGNGDMWVRKSGESSDTKVGSAPLTLGVSYHYDIVSDGTNIIFYRDGKQIGSIAATVDFPSSGVRYAAFGFSDAHNSYGYGNYSHIRFRNSAVSAATIGAEFNEKLVYKNDSGEDTVNGKSGALNVSNSGSHSYTDAFVSHNASSYTFAGWVNPGATVNANVIMGIGSKERRNHAPYGRYFILEEDGTIRFNYCSGSSSGGNWSQHYVDIFSAFSLSADTWSYLQVNIVPVNTNQVKLTVYKDGVSTYSNDITLTTKVDDADRTGNDYCYGMLGFMQLPTNHVYLGNMFDPAWYQVADDTSYVKDVRVYTQAMDPAYLYQAEVAEEYVKANISAGYLPTFNQEAYHQGTLATNGYSNLVYAPVWTTYWNTCAYNSSGSRNQYNQNGSSSGELTCGHVNHLAYKMPMPTNSVMVYDGEHTPATPVELELWSYGGWGKLGELYFKGTDISGTNFDKFILNEYWYGFSNDYTQWVGTTYNESNYSSKNDDWNGKVSGRNNIYDDTRHDGSTHMFWWNRLNYQGTGDYNNYYEKFSTITFGVYSTTNDNSYGNWTTEHVQNEGANIYVLNYKPVYDILKNSGFTGLKNGDNGTRGMSIKAVALTLSESEDLYTTSSVEQLYLALYKLMKCDPNNYLSNSTAAGDVETQVQKCAAAIKDAVLAFEGVNLELRADFSSLDSTRSSAISTHLNTLGGDSQTKTTTSLNALQTTLDSLEYTSNKTTDVQRADMSANAYQSAINSEKTSIDNSVAALDTLYDFDTYYTELPVPYIDGEQRSYNEIYSDALEVIATKGTASQVYTTDTIQHLESVVAALAYMPASKVDLKDVGYNKDRSAIGDEVDVLLDALTVEDEYDIVGINGLHYNCVSELAALEEKYNQGDAKLKAISEEAPLYTKSSVDNLITAVDTAKTNAATTVAQRRNTDALTSKSTIEAQTSNINTYISSLETSKPASVTDLSAYRAAISKVQDIDPDIYDTTKFNEYSVALCAAYISGSDSTYTDASSDSYTIKTISDSKTQTDVDNATSATLGYLTTNLKTYTITLDANGRYSTERDAVTAEAPGRVDGSGRNWTGYANSKAVITAATADTAWYMSYTSGSGTTRSRQYQGYGEDITLNVLGNMSIEAVQATEDKPNKVTINRSYSDNQTTHGISSIDFAGSSYTLPAAPALAYYTFTNYTYGGNTYMPGDTITGISRDILVSANYTKSVDNEYTVKVSTTTGDGDVFGGAGGDTAAYNTKITASDDSAYAWVERPEGGSERIFYIGKDLTFFVTDSVEVRAITKAEYDSAGYVVPKVNLRSSGVVISDASDGKHKFTFNGQVVHNNAYIVECGILVGKATSGTITNDDMVLANTGTQDGYRILRAKSTQQVGANQFTIGVTTNLTGAFKYRGYAVYQVGSDIITVYSDVVDTTIS